MNMNYKKLDISRWNRLKQYEFFKAYDNPFFNICSSLDVTELKKQSGNRNISYSTALLYASIHIANECKSFKLRLLEDAVIECDSIYAGSTVLNDDETFRFCYFDYHSSFVKFNAAAQKQLRLQQQNPHEFDGDNQDLNIIHYSIIPWISFTSFSHPRNYKSNDSIPKIVFGKYYEKQGRLMMPISIEVHHALMDGFHMGQYLSKLQEFIHNPCFLAI